MCIRDRVNRPIITRITASYLLRHCSRMPPDIQRRLLYSRQSSGGTRMRRGLIVSVLLSFLSIFSIAQVGRQPGASRPAPRWPDGRVRLSSPEGERGLWGGSGRLAINPRSYEPRTTLNAPIHIDDVPLHPWARAMIDYRHSDFLKV